jgi:hypothetical protein
MIVRGSLRCGIATRLMSAWGHNKNPPLLGLYQLPPATDITVHPAPTLCAKTGSEQSQQTAGHSITSSARADNVGGISAPTALAVLRLMEN